MVLPVTALLPAFSMGNTCPSFYPILRWAIPYELCNIRTFRSLWKIWVVVLPVTSLLLTFQMQNKSPYFPPILTYSIPHRSCKISDFPVQLNIWQLVLLETTPLYTFWERNQIPICFPHHDITNTLWTMQDQEFWSSLQSLSIGTPGDTFADQWTCFQNSSYWHPIIRYPLQCWPINITNFCVLVKVWE